MRFWMQRSELIRNQFPLGVGLHRLPQQMPETRNGARIRTIGVIATTITMCVVLSAGILKASDIRDFAKTIETWGHIPRIFIPYISLGVPMVEIGLSAAWLLGMARVRAQKLLLYFLIVTTLCYVVESLLLEPPRCGCFGKFAFVQDLERSMWWVVGRNTLLIATLLLNLYFRTPIEKSTKGQSLPIQRVDAIVEASPAPRAYTLIEVILSIALIGLLIALTVPSLKGMKETALSTKVLADLRQHGSVFASYANDHKECFPCPTDPSATSTVIRAGGRDWLLPYFDCRIYWWLGLADAYYDGNLLHPSFSPPYKDPAHERANPYSYSISLIARPEYWNLTTRAGPSQLGATRWSEALFPSKKIMLINDSEKYSLNNVVRFPPDAVVELAACDGSARTFRYHSLTRPVPSGEGPRGDPFVSVSHGMNGVHTVNGVRGVDIP